MSDVNGVVVPGYQFAADAQKRFRVTKTRLNLLGSPTVVVPLADAVDLEDITGDLAALIRGVDIDVGTEASDKIDVTLQAQDARGVDLEEYTLLLCWLSDAAYGAATGTVPNTDATITTGVEIQEVVSKKQFLVLTDATGKAVMRVDNTGGSTHTWYLNVVIGGRVYVSDAITITI